MSAKKLNTVCPVTGTITITVEKYNHMQRSLVSLLRTYESSLETIQHMQRTIENLSNHQPREIIKGQKIVALHPKNN